MSDFFKKIDVGVFPNLDNRTSICFKSPIQVVSSKIIEFVSLLIGVEVVSLFKM